MNFRHFAIGASVGIGAAASAGMAVAGTLTIDYTMAVAAVPLSPWTLGALGVALAGATVLVLRRRGWGQGVACTGLALLGLSGLGLAHQVEAMVPGPVPVALSLDGSGSNWATLNSTDIYMDVTVTNNPATAATLTVIDQSPGYIELPGATCEVGTVLLPGASCILNYHAAG